MAAWAPPEAFDDFRLIRPIRKGGQGKVYLGQDISLHRNVAIKFIADPDPDEGRRQRFRIEARAIAQLSHFNVVTAYKFGEVEGRPYLASEFVSGTPLDLLDRPVSRDLLLRVAAGLARGLAEAHARGILHRDIKPSNAVLTDPPQREVKLIDFGLAKFVDVGARTVSLPMDSSRSEHGP